jgi:hypothetical protein
MECGRTVSNMVKACFSAKKKIVRKKAFGMKAKELDGFLNNKYFNFFPFI